MKPDLTATLVAAALAAAAPATYAQDPGAARGPERQFSQRHHHERAFRNPTERVEARLAYIRTALKITDSQQPQWDAFAAVLRKHAAAREARMNERRAAMEKAPGERKRPSLVERHERQRAFMAAAAQRLDELIAVEKPLYAALSPEQQRVADEVLAPRGRGGPGGHFRQAGFHRN